MLFGLMVLFLLNHFSQMAIAESIRSVFSRAERNYGGRTKGIGGTIGAMVFRLGMIALIVYLVMDNGEAFTIFKYLKIVGVVMCIYALQMLLATIVGFVFLPSMQMVIMTEQYDSIRNLVCVLLWPVALLIMNIPNKLMMYILCGLVAIVFTSVVLVKGVQFFYRNALTPFYIILYFTSLEVVPMMGILLWAKHIV